MTDRFLPARCGFPYTAGMPAYPACGAAIPDTLGQAGKGSLFPASPQMLHRIHRDSASERTRQASANPAADTVSRASSPWSRRNWGSFRRVCRVWFFRSHQTAHHIQTVQSAGTWAPAARSDLSVTRSHPFRRHPLSPETAHPPFFWHCPRTSHRCGHRCNGTDYNCWSVPFELCWTHEPHNLLLATLL